MPDRSRQRGISFHIEGETVLVRGAGDDRGSVPFLLWCRRRNDGVWLTAIVAGGGGLEWFLATERKAVLAFLAARLPDPSHALTLCRMDQAIARARAGGARFVPHEIRGAWQRLSAGRYAALVRFSCRSGCGDGRFAGRGASAGRAAGPCRAVRAGVARFVSESQTPAEADSVGSVANPRTRGPRWSKGCSLEGAMTDVD